MNTVIVLYSVSVPTRVLASTALVLSAGVASAQGVALSGDARMGLVYNGDDVLMTSRARVTFTMSGETDTGLAFGASFRADNAGAAAGNTRMTGGTVFISGDFGKLTMGDVASAARAAAGDLYGVGLTGLGDLNEMAYLDREGMGGFATGLDRRTAALYEYSIDGFTGYIGIAQNNRNSAIVGVVYGPGATIDPATGDIIVATDISGAYRENYRDNMFSVGAKYTFEGVTGAIGYEYSRARLTNSAIAGGLAPAAVALLPGASFTASHIVASLEYAMDGFKGKAFVGRAGGDLGTALTTPNTTRTQYGLSVQGSFDATTVTAFANRTFLRQTHYGIGASYDLGGGASIVGGIAREGGNAALGLQSNTTADFGLSFKF